MRVNYKHVFALFALSFLIAAPMVAATNTGGAVVAQDIGEEFFFDILQNGAEIAIAAIGPQGEAIAIYGQLGIPSEELALSDPMYTDCMLMALISTHGELLDYLFDLLGSSFFNITASGGDDFTITQFGEGGFDINSILQMLGTEFNLLINVFFNAEAAAAQTNMAAIKAHMNTQFDFVFTDVLNLRIDESFFPPESGIELPFESIDIFISQVVNPFEEAVEHIFDVMDQTGLYQSIDPSVFTEARASGAGLLAIPDLEALASMINSFGGEPTSSLSTFTISQFENLTGSVAVAFAGYIGDQVLSTSDTELNIFEDIFGKPSTGTGSTITAIDDSQALVVCLMPEHVNVTSYSPEDEASNRTYYDNESNIVFWNATYFPNQPDYTVSFDEGSFPPLITIIREFSPDTVTPGGSAEVTVAIHNEGTEAVTNVSVVDDSIASTYASVTVSGTTSGSVTTLAPGQWLNITYTVTFAYEGGYAFAPAEMMYVYNGTTYHKQTHIDGYIVSPDPLGLLIQMFNDGMPFTGIAVGVVGLGAIVNIALMARGKGGGGTYQV